MIFRSIIEKTSSKEVSENGQKERLFRLGYIVSVILAIIPVTSWICGAVTRFLEGKIVAGLIRIIFGFTIVWIIDLILMIISKHILRLIPV